MIGSIRDQKAPPSNIKIVNLHEVVALWAQCNHMVDLIFHALTHEIWESVPDVVDLARIIKALTFNSS